MSTLMRHIPATTLLDPHRRRMIALYATSRGVLGSAALIIAACALYGLLQRWAAFDGRGSWGPFEVGKQALVVQAVPILIAAAIGVSAWSPFGEYERSSASPLSRMRALQAGVLLTLGLALTWFYLSLWTWRHPEIDLQLVAIRSTLGLTGLALLAGRIIDARLSWLAPFAMGALGVTWMVGKPLEHLWDARWWAWTSQAHGSAWSWFAALGLFGTGVAVFLRDGAKDSAGEDE